MLPIQQPRDWVFEERSWSRLARRHSVVAFLVASLGCHELPTMGQRILSGYLVAH